MSVEETHSSQSDSHLTGDPPTVLGNESPEAGGQDYPIEPLSASMMAKLFGVPLLIITVIVGGAVCVVFLFGAPSAPKAHSLDHLLHALEISGGQRNAGMLLPREKEHWQAGLELTERLKKDEFSPEQLDIAATRLIQMVENEMAEPSAPNASLDDHTKNLQFSGAMRMQFLIRALGRTNKPQAVPVLIRVLEHSWIVFGEKERKLLLVYTVQELANLHNVEGSKAAVTPLVALLESMDDATMRLATCTALSVLASPDNQAVIDALSSVRLSSDGEVGWSAAIALARLGSQSGKSTMLDLLDRKFWETGERYHTIDESGTTKSYAMPANLIQEWLMAAIDAAAILDDVDLWEMIKRLKSDTSPAVQQRAKAAWAARST